MYDRIRARVSLPAIVENYRYLRRLAGRPLMAVIKADAYGHGAAAVAAALRGAGADWLAVATAQEALSLREEGIDTPLLVLGAASPRQTAELMRQDIAVTIVDPAHALELSGAARAAGGRLRAHFKLDTGMARLGFADLASLHPSLTLPGLAAEGLFSHCATADTPDNDYALRQYAAFAAALDELAARGHYFPYTHCTNSGGVLHYKNTPGSLARVGLALYGYVPGGPEHPELRPAMTFQSVIAQVRTLRPGDSTGYERRFIARRDTKLAVIACGYADGYHRALSCGAPVIIAGTRCPVAGLVCMDIMMADITDAPPVIPGDPVLLFGTMDGLFLSPSELAERAGTNVYELLCSVSARVPRFYE